VSKSNTCLIFINQIRMKIGVMFGNPETTTGGRALKFYASVRLEVRRIETIEKSSDEAIGNRVRIKVVKNKVAPPFRQVEVDMMFGEGLSTSGSLLDAAVQNNIIEKSGSWYSYGKERIGQGRDAAKKFLQEHQDLSQKIDAEVRKIVLPERKRKAAPEAAAPVGAPEASAVAEPSAEPVAPAAAHPARRASLAKAAAAAKEPKDSRETKDSKESGEAKELF
jgi:recombination protein RecA